MKRYMCIKDAIMSSDNIEAFSAGTVYPGEDIGGGCVSFIDNQGYYHSGSKEWLDIHFKELEPIDDELYENPLEEWHPLTLMEERQLPAWARIAVAVFISAILLFLIAML